MSDARAEAVAVDLGSTSIKAGILDARGRLAHVESVEAPALRGEGTRREGDADAYARAASGLLDGVASRVARGTPLGIATQRSSFTLWSRADGRPRWPLISWQDRRAADWCDRHRGLEAEVIRRTGLLLSAHYVGPKLATMQESDGTFRDALRDGRHALGTLETLLVWRWSDGRRHESDGTVAARTALVDLGHFDWSPELLSSFDVPRAVLPLVAATAREPLELDSGLRLTATLSDQAAAALAVFDPRRPCALVNLGTGAFVLRETDDPAARLPGYLTAPILSDGRGGTRYCLEGAVNGAGPAVDACSGGPTELRADDPTPRAFAIPDRSGLGSPYWRPEIGLTFSGAAERLAPADRRRVVLEGLLFRVRQILEDLHGKAQPPRVVLAGGLMRDPAVAPGLAALLGRSVEVLHERESGLLGASRLAAGLAPHAASPTETVQPGATGSYLATKYVAWRLWLDGVLSA